MVGLAAKSDWDELILSLPKNGWFKMQNAIQTYYHKRQTKKTWKFVVLKTIVP